FLLPRDSDAGRGVRARRVEGAARSRRRARRGDRHRLRRRVRRVGDRDRTVSGGRAAPRLRAVRVVPDRRGTARHRGARGPLAVIVLAAWCSGSGRASSAGFCAPVRLFISVAAMLWLFRVVDGLVGPLYLKILGRDVPGLGILTTAVAIVLVGAIATNVVGKRLLQRAEWLLLHML